MKKCPYCAEEIQEDAIYCRYCTKDLKHPLRKIEQYTEKKNKSYWFQSIFIGIGISTLLYSNNWAKGNTNLESLLTEAILNVLIYSLLSSLIIWLVRRPWGKLVILSFGAIGIIVFIFSLNQAKYAIVPTQTQTFLPKPTNTHLPLTTKTVFPLQYTVEHLRQSTPTIVFDFGSMLPTPMQSAFSWDSEHYFDIETLDTVNFHATNLAIEKPFKWQIFNLVGSTRYQDIYEYYLSKLSKLGYRVSFNDQGDNGVYLLKFINNDKCVTIQFWEANPNSAPATLVIYEGW